MVRATKQRNGAQLMKQRNLSVLSLLVVLILIAGLSQVQAQTANVTIQLGTNDGVASFISDVPNDGSSYVANGAYSILVTLSNGNVLEITAIPEPSALALTLFVGLSGLALRWKRAK